MKENFITSIVSTWSNSISEYFKLLQEYPIKLVSLILDLAIVIFIVVKMFQIAKGSRALQLIKGIILFILITWLSGILNLTIVHSVLTAFLPSGVIALVVIFQPEIRRGLEQIGTNKFTNLFGMDKSIETKTREDIYKIVIAVEELAKTKTGALIVIQRDISLSDIISTGIEMNSEISPQLLVNIFVPKTPLHDGAVVINNNRIAAAACILPLANNTDISKELGTRHRAAVGISKEYDAIAIVVSEESGKISIAKDGTLIVDVKEDALKKILIKNIITNRLDEKEKNKLASLKNIQELKKKDKEESKENKEADKCYNGWQKQPDKLNIQGEIERAIFNITKEEVELIGSGRTDAGVHALGQIANFKTNSNMPIEKMAIAINSQLKNSIIIKKAEEVDERFHSRYNAKQKTYRYIINNSEYGTAIYRNLQYCFPIKLDAEKMKEAAKYFEGEHDFKAFKSSGTSGKNSVRTIYKAEVRKEGDNIIIELTGNGFLYNMVRIISGTLLDVGLGKIKPEEIPEIIESKDRQRAGRTLPAHGLYLVQVVYN